MIQKFLNPEDEYSPIPFWFWNDTLTEAELRRQIQDFNEKGVKGFVIHPRIGIPHEIEYLSDHFMEFVAFAVKEADKLGMKVVLYDEAMYPSGSAHGMVVQKNPDYASKALKMTEYKGNGEIKIAFDEAEFYKIVSVQAVKKASEAEIVPESITLLKPEKYEISFIPEDDSDWSVLVFSETFTNGHIRGIHFGEDDGEPNAPASSDLLNPDAMKEFIKLTHDRYYQVLSEYFGNTIIGMFTDEPCIMGRGIARGLKPWTGGFLSYYQRQGNSELDLPYLWFQAGELTEQKRRNYDEAINLRMEEAYYQPIFEWCDTHNIALTGHPHESDDIGFLKYFHIPAQDVVWRWVAPENNLALEGQHSTMAKCSSDSARHRNKRRNGNECFACCGKDGIEWAFTADDMKWYMDWLFVRGVNLLYPHAFFYSVDGPRRSGERPPDVGPNNIWWPHYNQISSYIKRMSYLMTDSFNTAQVAVLCSAHQLPWQIVKPLYENQIEFNYLEQELLLSEHCRIDNSCIKIAQQAYKILVIEDSSLIDAKTQLKLEEFVLNGGKVVIYNPKVKMFPAQWGISIYALDEVVQKIDELIIREVKVAKPAKDLRVTHILKDTAEFYLFVNEGEEDIDTQAVLKATGAVEHWDAWAGVIKEPGIVENVYADSITINLNVKRRESKIIRIDNKKPAVRNLLLEKNRRMDTLLLDKHWVMGNNSSKTIELDCLLPWNTFEGLEYYSGTMIYQNSFTLQELPAGKIVELHLGEVCEIPCITVNGIDLDTKLWSPYNYDITNYVKEGENRLTICITNTLANRFNNLSLKSGLLGPVKINFSQLYT
ncbi:glycosylhydrolase-like jelly roll fold domain-containing protein [Anaerocolumna cellulosilytica]|nr:glycosyl hydrolase [Anaerocolumna cellulosilytica]